MALEPTSSPLIAAAQETLSASWSKLRGAFSSEQYSPENALINTPNIDPRFIPRAPMSSVNIDTSVLTMLGRKGFKRGKEITAATHPELYGAWVEMSKRAGLPRVPQLILAESDTRNAITLSPEEVVISTGLMKILNMREVAAVLGHELGHEASNHTKPRAIALGVFGGGGMLAGDAIAHRGGIGSFIDHESPNPSRFKRAMRWAFGAAERPVSLLSYLFYMAVGLTAGSIVANQVSVRPTELEADRKGAAISGDPEALISALTKLDQGRDSKSGKHWIRLVQSGYPSHESRVRHLRAVAKTLPPAPPVAAMIEAQMPISGAPSPQITSASLEARVDAPVQAQVAGI